MKNLARALVSSAVLVLALLASAPAFAQVGDGTLSDTVQVGPSTQVKAGKATLDVFQPEGKPPAGGRPTIVIVPGLGCLTTDYTQVTRFLVGRGFNVAIFETDGNTELEAKVWDERLAKVTDQLLEKNDDARNPLHGTIDEGKLGIMGHSLGGSVAVLAAARDPRFKALVVFAPGGKDQGFLEAARRVQGATLAIDASLDRITPPDEQGGVVVANSPNPAKAHLVVQDGAHPNSPADFDADFIRDSGRVVPTMKYVGFFPVMGFTYDFPIVPGIKPMPSAEQRKIGFDYLGPWMERFVAGKTDTSVDFGKRAAAQLASGVLSQATVSAEAATSQAPRGSKARRAADADLGGDALAAKIRARGAQAPRNGIVDGLARAGVDRDRGADGR